MEISKDSSNKKCTLCLTVKDISDFYNKKARCKNCIKMRNKDKNWNPDNIKQNEQIQYDNKEIKDIQKNKESQYFENKSSDDEYMDNSNQIFDLDNDDINGDDKWSEMKNEFYSKNNILKSSYDSYESKTNNELENNSLNKVIIELKEKVSSLEHSIEFIKNAYENLILDFENYKNQNKNETISTKKIEEILNILKD
jgi:hypothetical protein